MMNIIPENGSMTINGRKMTWMMKRSKAESAFGIRGSRIFELELTKDGDICGKYEKGWYTKIADEDEESNLCLSYLIDRFGKARKIKRKEMGSPI